MAVFWIDDRTSSLRLAWTSADERQRLAILHDMDRHEQLIEESARATAIAQDELDDLRLSWRYLILGLMMLELF
ncbi:hypothetical protein [Thiorhodovibrio frisius]|uniref:Uncharacterized protein n=1 Tax=Thiorhodovibrio frisius TaxID=631362 RepID=H8Z6A8_9GAMM|nr:hypothetical protein [Thiorhodovibrio frisius]EIC20692.1 hypothetical protein Thi970DRAFT_04347 [Thiorhodovibrio frisius]WPL21440.1 hypothetical protein Thiofri_01565 [Thiorhodovibrio frisius]